MIKAISLEKVYKKYPTSSNTVIRNLDLEIDEGEFICIVGPSGCGKTTVLKMIAGLEQPSSGMITKPNVISVVFQTGALLPWLTAQQNVAFGMERRNLSQVQAEQEALKYLEMVNLSNFVKKYPREMSGGQRQRVGIARALAVEPSVLLLDEPFSALDTITTENLHQDLLKIWQQTKATIVMVSHSLEEAILLADRVVVMRDGSIQEIVKIEMPRPRTSLEVGFLTDLRKLKKALHS